MAAKISGPVVRAILAAVLFGASSPVSKALLGEVKPIPLAGLLYLGSGIGVITFMAVRRVGSGAVEKETRLTMGDAPWLLGSVVAGGIAAPIVLLFGLRHTPAATASLLLNFENVATALIAWAVFHEAVGRKIWWAVVCITAGSIILSMNAQGNWGVSLGAVGILGACTLWGLDNNFLRNISAKDPLAIVAVKMTCSGVFSLALARALHMPMPSAVIVLIAMLSGIVTYGMSELLFILALRGLGAARAGAYYGTAPFMGAALSFLVFLEWPNAQFLISLPLMVLGVWLLISEERI